MSAISEALQRPRADSAVRTSLWLDAARRFRRHRLAMVGTVLLTMMVVAVLVGPLVYRVPINEIDFKHKLKGPTWQHPFGTDDLGQDLLARMLYGGRISLAVGLVAMLIAIAALAGCSDGEQVSCPPVGAQPKECRPRTVVASFYPLAWATERVAGASVDDVVNLTPPGVEPHDIELSPGDVETIRDAELVVYIGGGFQPALEDAIASREGRALDLLGVGEEPHVWLDPIRFAQAVERIAEATGGAVSAYDEIRALKRLDADYRRGLADCRRNVLVTTHAAFGHLAERYGLTQLSLAGRSPESEPSPRELEGLIEEVSAADATTVFAEPLVSDEIAETVAREAGVALATLDPLEGLSDERLEAGEDYLSVMRSNLAALREALGCR